ncbi:acylphosphatase [Hymenobacter taeanensis]|uniref:acylphosphatase n=1 Tax=Hymenobacter taeanensis TaxID=2735321 RepID=A0A6M6BHJ3_9BACT|nr:MULTISPECIES: acylphosphatase [Hymenobacter]QJX47462.1 acylphosphatase [Hymenobacter taeanensis]UOQ83054.1 acylphosphatase [Hymenobacter sp. 5414T-23]
MSIEHRTIHVHGRVQGVFYRQSTRAEARRLGLTGTVCNNPDGTVTIEAEGPAAALDALAAWCQQGPPAAKVEKIEAQPGLVRGYEAFEVKREA